MIGTAFATLIREYTQTDSVTLTDALLVILANVAKDDLASRIGRAKQDTFVIPATADLVLNQREYGLPSDILNQLNKVEVKFSDSADYIRLNELDLNVYKKTDQESIITSQFSNDEGNCFYDMRRSSIFLYSGAIVAVDEGLKIFFNAHPEDISSGDLAAVTDIAEPSVATGVRLPRIFHELWARKISINWKSSRQRPVPLNDRELKYEADLEEKITDFSVGNTDRSLTAKLPNDAHLQG